MMENKNVGLMLLIIGLVLLLVLVVIKVNFDKQAVFMCEAVENNPALTMEDCPAHNSTTPWLILSSFGIAILILLAGVYFVFLSKEGSKKNAGFKKINENELDSDEKKIYSFLREKEGSAYQSDIVSQTEFSKVKVTRILDKLETKDVIERKRRGMTNIIFLK